MDAEQPRPPCRAGQSPAAFDFIRIRGDSVSENPDSPQLARRIAGGSYRDIMRVSAADPELWRGIFHENRAALLAAVEAWETELASLKTSLLAE